MTNIEKATPEPETEPVAKTHREPTLADVVAEAVHKRAEHLAWTQWPDKSEDEIRAGLWLSDEGCRVVWVSEVRTWGNAVVANRRMIHKSTTHQRPSASWSRGSDGLLLGVGGPCRHGHDSTHHANTLRQHPSPIPFPPCPVGYPPVGPADAAPSSPARRPFPSEAPPRMAAPRASPSAQALPHRPAVMAGGYRVLLVGGVNRG